MVILLILWLYIARENAHRHCDEVAGVTIKKGYNFYYVMVWVITDRLCDCVVSPDTQ